MSKVGLTKPQTAANFRYYQTIKETLSKDHPKMAAARVEKKAREAALKYAERQHKDRAKMIAQTEIAKAYNKGTDMAVKQAQAEGYLGRVKRVWNTSGDRKVCPVCRALDGMEIPMDKDFNSLFGSKISAKYKSCMFSDVDVPPAHPRCACAVEYEPIDEQTLLGENPAAGSRKYPLPGTEEAQDYPAEAFMRLMLG